MSGTQKQQQLASNLGEEALEIAIKNVPFDSEMIKALRLTCKRTKVAADARVKMFTMAVGQEPEAVGRSGLLNSITKLGIHFDLMEPSGEEGSSNFQNVSRACGLLKLAVDVCSKSLKSLEVGIAASPKRIGSCAFILGEGTWKSLEEVKLLTYTNGEVTMDNLSMPGFLAGLLAGPGSVPALKRITCIDPCSDDIEILSNSEVLGNLAELALCWWSGVASNKAPATIAAMRILLHKATNLESLHVDSSTFEFFDCEQLTSLKSLYLETSEDMFDSDIEEVTFAPALARPWKTLESLCIENVLLKAPDLVRIFEAEDTLPALKELKLEECSFDVDALSCVRRPPLETFIIEECESPIIITKLAHLMREADNYALPSLREFHIDCEDDFPIGAAVKALSKFISCPCAAALETLTIQDALIGFKGHSLLNDIANNCPKLKHLDLQHNILGRPAVATLAGYGLQGAWPHLKTLGILDQSSSQQLSGWSEHLHGVSNSDEEEQEELNKLDAQHPYLPKLDVQDTLRRVWPGLECF